MDREGFYHRDGEAVLNEQKTFYYIRNNDDFKKSQYILRTHLRNH